MTIQSDLFIHNGRSADFSPCGRYRYRLTRQWDPGLLSVVFIGLNPSTADADQDDPTIRRCCNFAKAWGYGGIIMLNLFAFRATAPTVMKAEKDPIGIGNNRMLETHSHCSMVVAAWGNHGAFRDRDKDVIWRFYKLHCLAVNQSTGQPQHPLYIKASATPVPYEGRP